MPLRKALEIDPSSADAHAALAVVFQTEMEPKLADEEYRKALASDSRNARVLNNYGGFLYEQKRYEEAYQRLLEASQDTLYPERSRVFENLGLVSLQMKKPAQAKEYFEKSLRLNRNQPSVALEMADLLYKEREYVPARQYYDLFAQGGGQNARSLLLGIRLAKVFEPRHGRQLWPAVETPVPRLSRISGIPGGKMMKAPQPEVVATASRQNPGKPCARRASRRACRCRRWPGN